MLVTERVIRITSDMRMPLLGHYSSIKYMSLTH